MDPNVKEVKVTGDAAGAYGGGKRQTRRKSKGGGSSSPGTITQLSASHVPGIPTLPVIGNNSPLTQAGAPALGGGKAATAAPVVIQKATAVAVPAVKVVLAAAKKRPAVVLAAPKAAASPKKTRHATRSIKVSMSGLGKRLTRAKTIRKDAGGLPLSDIKKALIKAVLIKADSKAPEAILRQMYADYMVLKERAL